MSDYELYYWQLPFRGQFIRALLAWAGQRWVEFDDDAIGGVMDDDVTRQAIPFKGPPMLVDRRRGFALAEMPAIAYWLGETLGLLPSDVDGTDMAWQFNQLGIDDCLRYAGVCVLRT